MKSLDTLAVDSPGWVIAVINIIRFDTGSQHVEIGHNSTQLCAYLGLQKIGYRDSRKNANDCNDDEQLDQRESGALNSSISHDSGSLKYANEGGCTLSASIIPIQT